MSTSTEETPEAAVYRVFEALDELQAMVESARGMPMSASCVLPRAHLLDLIDDVRDALPTELDDAQVVLGNRDDLLNQAREEWEEATERNRIERDRVVSAARSDADAMLREARDKAQRTVETARAEAERTVAAGQTEHDRLVRETEVHHSAMQQAKDMLAAAATEATQIKADADQYVEAQLKIFEDQLGTFADMVDRTARSVQKGREALRGRDHDGGRNSPPPPRAADGTEDRSRRVKQTGTVRSAPRRAGRPTQ